MFRNDQRFIDVTLRGGERAWLNREEIESAIEYGLNTTLVKMKSGREYFVDFDIDSFSIKSHFCEH